MLEVFRHSNRTTDATQPGRNLRQWWTAIAALLAAAVFSEAVFAGAMLSGFAWGRTAHAVTAAALMASTLLSGLIAVVTLRRIPNGLKLGVTLLLLAVVVFLQTALGRASAHGAHLMWV